jgi:hypothetical protein
MAGNRLGPKKKYLYKADDGTFYVLSRDESLAIAGTGVLLLPPVEFDPSNPPAGITVRSKPSRFKPRVVFIQDPSDGARKELICFDPSASLYATDESKNILLLDGDAGFVTTGRRGEKLTF